MVGEGDPLYLKFWVNVRAKSTILNR